MYRTIWTTLCFLLVSTTLFAQPPRLTSSTTMLELTKLTSFDAVPEDRIGISVAVDGDTAIVGMYGDSCAAGIFCGSAIIYERNATTGSFEEVVKLTASDAAEEDQFGHSVAISGNTAVVGSFLKDCNAIDTDCGAVYVFEKPVSGWAFAANETAKLTASDASEGDEFGTSVSVSGDTVVVGADRDDCNATDTSCGAVYVFEKPVSGWSSDMNETAKLTASDASAGDQLGGSVSVSGDTIVAGAQYDDDNGANSGSAYLYIKPVSGWTTATQDAKLTASDSAGGDYFGISVSISGDTIVVGADWDDDNGDNSGSAYLYEKPLTGWTTATQDAKLTASDGAASDLFGVSVAISGDNVVVGAQTDSVSGTGGGAAYFFQKPETGWADATQTGKMIASDGASYNWFGTGVAISGNTVFVGAYGNSSYTGAAYQFEAVLAPYVIENQENILDIEATDAEGDTISYTLSGGSDVSLLNINTSSGLLRFNTAQDFENPTDTNGDNIYEATLLLDDGVESASYRLFVKVSDLDDEGIAPDSPSFKELNKFDNPRDQANDYFGSHVAISGNTAVVASETERAVYVYEYQSEGNAFVKVARLTPTAPVQYWGESVAISGDVVVVGAHKGYSSGIETGLAYIFEKPAEGWSDMTSETAQLSPSVGAWYDQFGYSVAISGDTVVVGARYADINPAVYTTNEGAAYIFAKPESGGWVDATENAKLFASDLAPNKYFGRTVAISGDTAVVQSSAGSYLFKRPLTGWANAIEDVKLTISNYITAAVSGDSVLLGYNGSFAALFQKPAVGEWKDAQSDVLKASASTTPFGFGTSVGISGDMAIVGASFDSSAYLFKKPTAGWGTNSYVYASAKLTASDGASDDQFGKSTAIFGNNVIIGAPYHDSNVSVDSGSVYLFQVEEAGSEQTDSDGDGIPDVIEDADQSGTVDEGETDPNDADTDDDGLSDGDEVNTYNTDPLDPDTDGDGLQDGTEVGEAVGHSTDTGGSFIPDADGGDTTTDPLNPDSDNDGLPDGVEDANGNGIVDAGETDPNVSDSARAMPWIPLLLLE